MISASPRQAAGPAEGASPTSLLEKVRPALVMLLCVSTFFYVANEPLLSISKISTVASGTSYADPCNGVSAASAVGPAPVNVSGNTFAAVAATFPGVYAACRQFFVVPNISAECPYGHMYYSWRSPYDGLGHQISEMLFGMEAALRLGRTFVWNPFPEAEVGMYHRENYDAMNELLGLNKFFDSFGCPRLKSIQNSVRWERIYHTVGEEVTKYSAARPGANCKLLYFSKGYHHCTKDGHHIIFRGRRTFVPKDCFLTNASAFLQEKYKNCLRSVTSEMGSLLKLSDNRLVASNKLLYPRIANFIDSIHTPGVVTIVWHVRVGDLIPHEPDDPHFTQVAVTLRNMTLYQDPPPSVHFFLIGGGSSSYVLKQQFRSSKNRPKENVNDPGYNLNIFEEGLREAVHTAWAEDNASLPLPEVHGLPNIPVAESMLVMANADIVVGSGSALVLTSQLFSDRVIFFSHEKSTVGGDPHGVFLMSDSVDLRESGEVHDSIPRLRASLYGLKRRKGTL